MMYYHLYAIGLAFVIDLIIGDPKNWPHPVKWIGSVIFVFDNRLNKGTYRRQKGLFMLIFLVITVFFISLFIVSLSYYLHPVAGVVTEAILIATTIAQKSLKDAALEVVEPLKMGELQKARKKLSYIVGRDTDELSEREIVRGTVETVAENTSDGITAPLFWAMIGGAPFALVYRTVNTCDSMVGYKNERYQEFGWASAKLDDLINWLPARLTAVFMMVSMKPQESSFKHALSVLYRDARKHNSPNSGWGEAAVAAILGVQLGGTNFYQGKRSDSSVIGDSIQLLEIKHIRKTIMMMERTVFLFLIVFMIGGILYELAVTWL